MASHTDEKLELLKATPLLAELDRHELEEVGRLADEVDIPAGRVLMKEGETGQEFFVIIDGNVRIDRGGTTVRTLGPGDHFGEVALLSEGPRTATATAETPLRLLVLAHREFHSLMAQFPSIQTSVLSCLATRLRRLEPEAAH
jgi:CRP/FNR family cyclic AMP-dependent transcriptional regulator